jgi:hypothetical protein
VAKTNAATRLAESPGAATNAVTKTVAKSPAGDEADPEKPPAIDATLVEAEHILVDYLSALSKGGALTAGQQSRPPGS